MERKITQFNHWLRAEKYFERRWNEPVLQASAEQNSNIQGWNVFRRGKKSKDRVTVKMCCNMDGSEKIKPLVLGKFNNPRCFKGIKTLPVEYMANWKAWMTSEFFERWVQKNDQKMLLENRDFFLSTIVQPIPWLRIWKILNYFFCLQTRHLLSNRVIKSSYRVWKLITENV